MLALSVVAQDSSNSAAQATAVSQPAPQLSYGVPQVLQLAQAKVSDDTIVAYIQNSGTIYALNASEIVYLKQQGISDAVLNAMLNQRSRLAQSATQPAPQQNYSDSSSAQTPNATVQPTVTYVQTVPSPTVYVVPDTQTYYYQPYYYGYYGWPYPAVSLSFGFGGWGGYHGYHGGGGFHGGGWHH
ncbi:MAG: hypothetical protein ABSG87_09160 [Verrucomicrobiota bacterium]